MVRAHLLTTIGAVLFGLLMGCTVEPLTRSGFRCEHGTCPPGFGCDPRDDVCVENGSACDNVIRRSPCNPDAADCTVHGCRICAGGYWSECVVYRDVCDPNTLACVGDELWRCDGAGRLAQRQDCGDLGCNDAGPEAQCNRCVPKTFRCEGLVRIQCDEFGVPTPEDCGDSTESRCANARACTTDGCVDIGDSPFGTPCDEGDLADGNFCNSRCDGGGNCVVGTPRCDDGRECTSPDACEPTEGCVFQAGASSQPCGDLCNQSCDGAGNCVAATVSCDDGNPCTTHACTAEVGCEYSSNDGATCDDGDPCTATDICAEAACLGSGNPCDDANPCTSDSCDAGCQNDPMLCQSTLGQCSEQANCDPAGKPLNCDIISGTHDGQTCTDCINPPCATCLAGVCQNADRCDGSPSATWCTSDDECQIAQCMPAECFAAQCENNRCTDQALAPVNTRCAPCPGAVDAECTCQLGQCTGPSLIVVSNLPGFDPCLDNTTDKTFVSATVDTGINGDDSSRPTVGGSALPSNSQVLAQGPGEPEIAVFYYNSIAVPADVKLTIAGQRAFALIACTSMQISGKIYANGKAGSNAGGGAGGPGGYAGGTEGGCVSECSGQPGAGPGAGGAGRYQPGRANEAGGGGGGAHAGNGGDGGFGNADDKDNNGAGGTAHPNRTLIPLRGGSGGGAGGNGESTGLHDARGGGGGGTIQLSANGWIVLSDSAEIRADGGNGANSAGKHGAGGGGSGGAILLEAPIVFGWFYTLLSANGGAGGQNHSPAASGASGSRARGEDGSTGTGGNGGGGGGGHIYVDVNASDWDLIFWDATPWAVPCYNHEGNLTYQ